MIDTARLRELVDLFDRSETHNMLIYAPAGDPLLSLSTEHIRGVVTEMDKMRTVVEAARAWDKRRGQFLQDKLAIELNEALSAMEQNDTAPSALQEGE